MEPTDSYKKLLSEARELYDSVGKISCPALGDVYFTSEGFHHLRYESSVNNKPGKERSKLERRNKLSHINFAIETLKCSTTIQEYRLLLEPVGLKDSKGFRAMANVHYYAFWAVLNKRTRVKVIVKQIENGKLIFWSVMPYWVLIKGQKIFGSAKLAYE